MHIDRRKTIEGFIDNLVNKLIEMNKYNGNDFDIPYIVLPMYKGLYASQFLEFARDLRLGEYNIVVEESKDDYGYEYAKINVFISDPTTIYIITICNDEHWMNYCMCERGDEGYNEERNCCGMDCDWETSYFRIERITNLGNYKMEKMLQKDYWKLEEEFYNKYPQVKR